MWCSSKRPFWYADWSIRFFRSKLTSPHSIPISFSGSTFNNIEIKLLEVKTLGISELHRKHSGSIWARKSKIFCLSFLYPSSKYVIYIPSLPIMAKIYRDNRVFERRSQKSPKCRLRKWGTDEKHLCVLHSIDLIFWSLHAASRQGFLEWRCEGENFCKCTKNSENLANFNICIMYIKNQNLILNKLLI